MYQVIVSSAQGSFIADVFDSFDAAEEYALDQFGLIPSEVVSIVDSRTGKQIFFLEAAA